MLIITKCAKQMNTAASMNIKNQVTLEMVKEFMLMANSYFHSISMSDGWNETSRHCMGSCQSCDAKYQITLKCLHPCDESIFECYKKVIRLGREKSKIRDNCGKCSSDKNEYDEEDETAREKIIESDVKNRKGKQMCVFKSQRYGFNEYHNYEYHNAWSRNPVSFYLPSDNEFWKTTIHKPPCSSPGLSPMNGEGNHLREGSLSLNWEQVLPSWID